MPQYYRQAIGALVLFDLTDKKTFISAAKWINEVKQKASSKCQLILIGNKSDRCLSKVVSNEKVEESKGGVENVVDNGAQ